MAGDIALYHIHPHAFVYSCLVYAVFANPCMLSSRLIVVYIRVYMLVLCLLYDTSLKDCSICVFCLDLAGLFRAVVMVFQSRSRPRLHYYTYFISTLLKAAIYDLGAERLMRAPDLLIYPASSKVKPPLAAILIAYYHPALYVNPKFDEHTGNS